MMNKTINKTIEFEKLIPDLKRFAAKKNSDREVLKYAYFDGKNIIATNAHIMIRINKDYIKDLPSHDPFLYDLTNKRIVEKDLNYPNTDRLIPSHFNTNLTLEDKPFKEIRKGLRDIMPNVKSKDKNNVMSLEIVNQSFNMSDRKDLTIGYDCIKEGEDIKLHVNCQYLINALMASNKLKGLTNDNIQIDMISHMRPFMVSQSDIYNIIILPVRIP